MAQNVNGSEVLQQERDAELRRLAQVAEETRNGMRDARTCDKCNRPVSADNDAVNFDIELGFAHAIFAASPRHLLPVVENGVVVCAGSPSRAQYLPGQQRDKRLSYAYQPDRETSYREAYDRMLRRVATENTELN